MALSVRQAKFVAEYLKRQDGKAVAIAAGYGVKGAAVQAARNLRIPGIREALRRAKASVVENVNRVSHLQVNANRDLIRNAEISAARTIKETAALAYYDHPDIPPETRYGNKVPALRLLSTQLGMIHSPGPAPMTGPIFQINIHTHPKGADDANCPIEVARTTDSQPADETPTDLAVVDESILK